MAFSAEEDIRVSCCVIARGRLDHLSNLLAGLDRQTRPADEVVLVSMGDPEVTEIGRRSTTVTQIVECDVPAGGELPLARARNLAAAASSGSLLVFLDVDCIPTRELVADYIRQSRPGLLMGVVRYLPPGVPATTGRWADAELRISSRPHPARPAPSFPEATQRYELFWSLNFAVRRTVWDALGGFDDGFLGYGGEDTDLAFTARREGVPAWFLCGAEAFHQHHPSHDPPLEHLDEIVANARYFHAKWGVWPMTGWLDQFAALGLIDWEGPAESAGLLRRR